VVAGDDGLVAPRRDGELGRWRGRRFLAHRGQLERDAVPAAADDVVINRPGTLTVALRQGTVSIRSLQGANNLRLAGGSLELTAGASESRAPSP